MKGYQENNKKWSIISEALKGRNLNSVKNRFHSILKKNGCSDPTNENIESIIQKLKKAEFSINTSKISSDTEEVNDEKELKFEEPKKQVKIENSEKSIQEMYKNMYTHFQFLNQYHNYLNMANSFLQPTFSANNFPGFLISSICSNFLRFQ